MRDQHPLLPAWGIRTYLAILVLATALPLAALVGFRIYSEAVQSGQRGADASSAIAGNTALLVAQFLDNTRVALESLAQKQSQLLDPAICQAAAATLVSINALYANLVVLDRADNAVCAAKRNKSLVGGTVDRESYERALREKNFLVGNPLRGPVTGRWVVIARQPLLDSTGEVIGLITLPLDLVNLQAIVSGAGMSPEALTIITSARGIVLARSVDADKWVGKDISGVSVAAEVAKSKQGRVTTVGVDRIERVYGYTTIPAVGWIVASGIPSDTVYASTRRTVFQSIAIMIAVLAMVAFLGLAISRAIAAPVRNLSETALAVTSGRKDTRARPDGPQEIASVSTALNTMLDSLAQGERLLSENETRLKLAMRVGHIGLRVWNFTTGERYVSPEWTSMLGYEEHELSDSTQAVMELIHPDDLPRVVAELEVYLGQRQPNYETEYRLRHRDGSYRWMLTRAELTLDEAGQPQQSISCYVDITEHKRVEAALREADSRYQDLYENAPDIYLSVDAATGHILQCNQTTVTETGYAKNEIVGQPVLVLYHPDCLSEAMKRFEQFMSTGEMRGADLQLRRKDGTKIDISVSASAVRDDAGKVRYSRSVWRVITERKQAEAAVKASEERLRAIITNEPECVTVLSLDGHLLEINRAGLAMIEADSAEQAQGRAVLELVADEHRATFIELHRRVVAGESGSLEFELVGLKGGRRSVETTAAPLRDSEGKITAQLGISRDITERKRADEALRRYAERMRDLSKRLMNSEEAERRNLSRELHDSIGQNLSALNLHLGIIRGHLAKGSPQAAGARLEDAQQLIEKTTRQVRNVMADLRPLALDDYGLLAALRIYCTDYAARFELPITVVGEEPATRPPSATELGLFRIAQEALNNVIKHARATHVEVEVVATPTGVRLTIDDDGAGFDPKTQSVTQASFGMATMRERAEALGADLRIESAPGRGTRVVVDAGGAGT